MSILKVGMYASGRIGANQNYLTFSSDAPFSIKFNQKSWDGVLEYSLDAQNWYEWDAREISSVGNVIYLRGLGNTVITNGTFSTPNALTMTSPTSSGISCTGNIMSLLDYKSPETAVMGGRCFAYMFYGCTNLAVAPELPATVLAGRCYQSMLRGCTSLTAAPELPATVLDIYCYDHMLYGCTNLTVAPELPATTLALACYQNMFYGTGIAISSTQTGIYQTPWRIPSVGTIASEPTNWNTDMLLNTKGTFKSNPAINTTYYQAN